MFVIEEKAIPKVVIPAEAVGIVVMQPFVTLSRPDPYRWPADMVVRQCERIHRTLEIAKRADHGCEKTHFTVFPEYAIPGLLGIARIEEVLKDPSWPTGTVVIGGTDWLSKEEYASLCDDPYTEVNSENRAVRDGQNVNCCVIWAIVDSGAGAPRLKRWLQPKICPNWPEEGILANDMFEGKCIYIFEALTTKGKAFRFMSVVCFDWIGPLGEGEGVSAILKKANELPDVAPYGKPLSLTFVPQRNEKPNHVSFLNSAYNFFHSQDYQFVDRDKCAILFANNAGLDRPGPCTDGKFGCSSLVFSPGAPFVSQKDAPPSYAVDTARLRRSEALRTCAQALFRENGSCIHSFRLHHPLTVDRAPESRRRPLGPVLVHPVDETVKDPRATGGQIPAIVKWVTDRAETLPPYQPPNESFQSRIMEARKRIVGELIWCSEQRLLKMIREAVVRMTEDDYRNIDNWSNREEQSLKVLIDSLTIVGCAAKAEMAGAPAHACIVRDKDVIDIVVVGGGRHQENLSHAAECHPGRRDRLTLIISCDTDDNPLTDRDKPVYDTNENVRRCALRDLKECLGAATEGEAVARVSACLGVRNA